MRRDTDTPRYGYGRRGRPLWTRDDRDRERIRRVLWDAGLGEGDCAVDTAGGDEYAHFVVAFTLGGNPTEWTTVLYDAGWGCEARPAEHRSCLWLWPRRGPRGWYARTRSPYRESRRELEAE